MMRSYYVIKVCVPVQIKQNKKRRRKDLEMFWWCWRFKITLFSMTQKHHIKELFIIFSFKKKLQQPIILLTIQGQLCNFWCNEPTRIIKINIKNNNWTWHDHLRMHTRSSLGRVSDMTIHDMLIADQLVK